MICPSDSKKTYDAFDSALRKHLRFYDKTRINWINLPKEHCEFVNVVNSVGSSTVPIRRYADYINTEATDNIEEKAKLVGLMCASVYNCLVQEAMHEFGFGLSVVDLFENNLKFNYVVNDCPSADDPMNVVPGWMSYRFKFAAGNAR